MALGSTQPMTKMSTRILPGGKKRPALRADNLAAMSENVGASVSRNHKGLHVLYRDNFTFTRRENRRHSESPRRDTAMARNVFLSCICVLNGTI
jgi:hypothetical protein